MPQVYIMRALLRDVQQEIERKAVESLLETADQISRNSDFAKSDVI